MGLVWIVFEERCGVEIPDRSARHDIEPEWPHDGEVYGRVGLLHEAILLCSGTDIEPDGNWTEQPLRKKFSGKRENDDVKGNESKILRAFAVVGWAVTGSRGIGVGGDERGGGGKGIGKKDCMVEWVGWARSNIVCG